MFIPVLVCWVEVWQARLIFGEGRFVRAGLIGASFGWVWYVSAGAVCHGTLVYVLVFLVGVC
jgi:hypothetical protein